MDIGSFDPNQHLSIKDVTVNNKQPKCIFLHNPRQTHFAGEQRSALTRKGGTLAQ